MMPHTVEVAPFVGTDRFNQHSYGPRVAYRARVVGKIITLRRADKEDRSPIFDVYVGGIISGEEVLPLNSTLFTTDDQIYLPSTDPAWVDHTPLIFAVARATDEDGHHHVKLQCGFMYHRQGQ